MSIPASISDDVLLSLFRSMVTVRQVELRLSREFKAGKLPGPVHLYVGQEAVAAGVCARLNERDWIASTHRGHGHFVAKGGALDVFFAEVYGRATGICGGKGGSMHVADVSKGILGANGIVAAGISLAAGAALSAQLQKKQGVAVAFFGDGAANQGVLAEALNVSALWKLPLVLVCENNGFSEFSPSKDVTAGRIYRRAEPFGVPSEAIDGNDVLAVWEAAGRAVNRARAGEGAGLIEALTYRFHGHTESEASFLSRPYRTEAEIDSWRAKDPIASFSDRLLKSERIALEQLRDIEQQIADRIDSAVTAAEQAPWPQPSEALENMFA